MKRPTELAKDVQSMSTIVDLTNVFQSLASMRIAQIKSQVLESQDFFKEIWQIYSQLRVDAIFHYGRRMQLENLNPKTLFIVITAEGGFSGDIDNRVIQQMRQSYDPEKHDILCVGHHGAVLLRQQGVHCKKYFHLPEKEQNINVVPLMLEVQNYQSTQVFYQAYVSLGYQEIRQISLSSAVEEKGKSIEKGGEEITEDNYIFEPSTFAVVDHLESSMLQIALSQVILDSKLAQYASRFRAMSAAHDRSDETFSDLKTEYNRSKRALKDERLKEIVNGFRHAGAH